jgi:hypothetical protein
MQYNIWNNIPKAIPIDEKIAIFLPYKNDCLEINAKSWPGLITANKWAIKIVIN